MWRGRSIGVRSRSGGSTPPCGRQDEPSLAGSVNSLGWTVLATRGRGHSGGLAATATASAHVSKARVLAALCSAAVTWSRRRWKQLCGSLRVRQELAGLSDSIGEFCRRVQRGLEEASFAQRGSLVELLIGRVIVTDGGRDPLRDADGPSQRAGPFLPFAIGLSSRTTAATRAASDACAASGASARRSESAAVTTNSATSSAS